MRTNRCSDERLRKELGAGSTHLPVFFAEVPTEGAIKVGARFGLGKLKYGLNNWKRGNAKFLLERMTHLEYHWQLFKRDGNKTDDNLGAVLWGGYVLAWYEANRPEIYNEALAMIQGDKVYDFSEKAGNLPSKGTVDRRRYRRSKSTVPRKRQNRASRNHGHKRSDADRGDGSDNRSSVGRSDRNRKAGSTSATGEGNNQHQRTRGRQKSGGSSNVRQGVHRSRTGSGGHHERTARRRGTTSSKRVSSGGEKLILEVK